MINEQSQDTKFGNVLILSVLYGFLKFLLTWLSQPDMLVDGFPVMPIWADLLFILIMGSLLSSIIILIRVIFRQTYKRNNIMFNCIIFLSFFTISLQYIDLKKAAQLDELILTFFRMISPF